MAAPTEKQKIEDVFDDICARISAGELLVDICDDVGISRAWFYKWLNEDQARVDSYARARDMQQESWADDIVKISEDSLNDTKEREDGSEYLDGEWVARCKLRVDVKKWLMARLAPRKYGDKLQTENHTTHDASPALLDIIRKGEKQTE